MKTKYKVGDIFNEQIDTTIIGLEKYLTEDERLIGEVLLVENELETQGWEFYHVCNGIDEKDGLKTYIPIICFDGSWKMCFC